MRTAKRLAVAAVITVLAVGVAPAGASANAGGKITNNAILCCR